MKKQRIISIVGILILTVAGSLYLVVKNESVQSNNQQASVSAGYEPITDSQGIVSVTVTPLALSATASVWKFDVVLDTHSGSLDQDMLTAAVLVDDSGKVYRPTNWDGAPLGGHHREGVLVFNAVKPAPKSIELKISGIGDVVRSFAWQLK